MDFALLLKSFQEQIFLVQGLAESKTRIHVLLIKPFFRPDTNLGVICKQCRHSSDVASDHPSHCLLKRISMQNTIELKTLPRNA